MKAGGDMAESLSLREGRLITDFQSFLTSLGKDDHSAAVYG